MNINLSLSKKKKTTNSLKIGLNPPPRTGNVFGDDDEEEEETAAAASTASASRSSVNQAVALEQEALRKRAAAALTEAKDSDVYDYDGVYDRLHPQPTTSAHDDEPPQPPPDKTSRYMQDLLKASKERQLQRELILERKIAKEQEAEAQQADYVGKEQFITAAYKRKLQERQVWLEQEKQREVEEEENQNKMERMGMAAFYGGLQKNVALGGAEVNMERKDNKGGEGDGQPDDTQEKLGFMDGFEPATNEESAEKAIGESNDNSNTDESPQQPSLSKRELREQKVAQARIRYLQRHNIAVE